MDVRDIAVFLNSRFRVDGLQTSSPDFEIL